MLTFVIGAAGTGKSTFASRIAAGRPVISAGRWARRLIEEQGGAATADELAEAALSVLRETPTHAARLLASEVAALPDRSAIVEGCRNPTDVLTLARDGDHVVDLGGTGASAWEREGLAAIRACRAHLARIGVTWSDYVHHLATLPEPLPIDVSASHLHNLDGRLGTERGRLLALESYQGANVTACWRSESGGVFHDLPLEAFGDCSVGGNCYAKAGAGAPVVELPPERGRVAIFDRQRSQIGVGDDLWIVHWPDDNLLLHLVRFSDGLLLWPPHKLMNDPEATELPDWKKRRR